MSTQRPKEPRLNRFPGNYILDGSMREAYNISDWCLVSRARDWSKPSILVKEYFNRLTLESVIPQSGQHLVDELIETFKAIAEDKNEAKGKKMLLCPYCSELEVFFKNKSLKEEISKLYRTLAVRFNLQKQQHQTRQQMRLTAETLLEEEGVTIENESREGVEKQTGSVERANSGHSETVRRQNQEEVHVR